MELKPGYKQTEIGVIPEDWEAKSIESIGSVIRGASPRPKGDKRFYGGRVPRLMVEDITRDKHWVIPSIDYLTEEGAKRSRLCKSGTLTIVCSGTPTAVGLPALLAIDACIHDGILALVRLEKSVSADFLFHQVSNLQQRLYGAATHGGTFVNLTTDALRAFTMVFPPTKAEQEAIAAALNDVDALSTSLDRLIAKKRVIKQAAMQELLTGRKRLPGFGGEWTIYPLAEKVEITKGQLITESNAIKGNVPVIAGGKQPAYYHNQPNRTGKTITISASGANAGYVAFTDIPIFASDCSTIGEGADYSVEFIYQQLLLNQERIYKLQAGGAQPHVHPSDLAPIGIGFPLKNEQQAIAEILSDMDAEITALRQKREKVRALKQGMMQELLTGRTRLHPDLRD